MFAVRTITGLSILAVLLGSSALSQPARAQSKKVVLIAGPKDHGAPGRHEYAKTNKALAYCLENASNLSGITTKLYEGAMPEDLNELSDANLIVFNNSSDRSARETHPLFPPDPKTKHTGYDPETAARLKQFDSIIQKGAGLAIFHYGLWVENVTAREYYLDWIGGVWVAGGSKNPRGNWEISQRNTDHPIQRGVHPWSFYEEIFYNPFVVDEEHRTDLLISAPVGDDMVWRGSAPDGPELAAWAYEKNGRRSFAYGGLDFHNTLKIDDVRRFVLNGLVWAAGMEVPEGGVSCTIPDELMQ